VKKISSKEKLGEKGEVCPIASGEEANNREKAREVYVDRRQYCPQDY